jgi:carboxymethylenebutenolidase
MGSTVDLKAADGFTLSAYTAGPAGGTKGIVIQEIFGVNHHMRAMATGSPRAAVCAWRCSTASGASTWLRASDIDKGRNIV